MRRLLLGLAGTLVTGVLSLTPSAAHAETTLCSGKSFDDVMECDPGWAVNMMFMHWRMFRGHNCTNYVAWRLGKDGVKEPNYLLGNARTWAPRAKDHGVRVDSTPAAGAVGAWSGRNHIVYVEEVGPSRLVLTEDSWSSKRYRRYIAYKGESGYPTTFIHFKGAGGISGPIPTLRGTPAVGRALTAHAGTWTPKGVKLSYRWLRNGVVIPGAIATTYTLLRADAGKAISVSVTGTLPGKPSRTASSVATKPVSAGTITPGEPTISGVPVGGTRLVADAGSWEPGGLNLTYQWYADGGRIPNADTRYFTVGNAQNGRRITVRVTGSGPGLASVSAESAPTPRVVKKGKPLGRVVAGTPRIVGPVTNVVGDTLTVEAGTWRPGTMTFTFQWLRGSRAIPGATKPTYTLTAADVGSRISVAVKGAKAHFASARATTLPTSVVTERLLQPTRLPAITGSGVVGEVMRVDPGVWVPGGTTSSYQWTRDGRAIRGATGATYRPSDADLRTKLGVVVTTRLAGWPSDSRTILSSAVVRTTPALTYRRASSRTQHAAKLIIGAVVADRPVAGSVRILRGGKTLRTFTLSSTRDGVVYEFKAAEPGRYELTLDYSGPEWTMPTTRDVVLKIK